MVSKGGDRWRRSRKYLDLLVVKFIDCMPITYSLSIRRLCFPFDAHLRVHTVKKYFISFDFMYFW